MKMYRRLHKDEGFTLVELMVVVLIIGILVAIAIPVFNAAQDSARAKTCQANQRTINGSVQQYIASQQNETAQTACDGLVAAANPLISGGYLKTAPKCPAGTAPDNSYNILNGTVNGDKSGVGWFVATHELK